MKRGVAVIGTTFVDCKGLADGKSGGYTALGRNTGQVRFVHGGVGRNIAENIAGLGENAVFISTMDDSALGQEVWKRMEGHGVELEFIAKEKNKAMGMWLVILDEKGEQAGSISHMPELNLLEQLIDHRGEEFIQRVSTVALEIDLTESIVEKVLDLAEKYHKPVYSLPGNLSVAMARPDFLPRMAGFICNHIEAGKLFGFDSSNLSPQELLEQARVQAEKRGIPCMAVTMGEKGAVYFHSHTKEKGYVPAIPTSVRDVSGAGDSFFSGTLCGIVQGRTLEESVKMGTKLASLTIQTSENCCQAILENQRLSFDDIDI